MASGPTHLGYIPPQPVVMGQFIPPPAWAGHTPVWQGQPGLPVYPVPPTPQQPTYGIPVYPANAWLSPFGAPSPAALPDHNIQAASPWRGARGRASMISADSSSSNGGLRPARANHPRPDSQIWSPHVAPRGFPLNPIPPYMMGSPSDQMCQSLRKPKRRSRSRRARRRRRRNSEADLNLAAPLNLGYWPPVGIPESSDMEVPQAPCMPSDGELYDVYHTCLRPKSWRPEFRASVFQKTKRAVVDVANIVSNPPFLRPTLRLTPCLAYNEHAPPLTCDMRQIPDGNPSVAFPYFGRSPNDMDMMQLASHPPTQRLTLYHARLPWVIHVDASWMQNGIIVSDVFNSVLESLHKPANPTDFWNDLMKPKDREQITHHHNLRCGGDPEAMSAGVLRVDFLLDDCVMIGIRKAKGKINGEEGIWEIVTRKLFDHER